MDILFQSDRDRDFFGDDKALKRKWGKECAGRIRRRLDDLAAADNLAVMATLPGRLHPLTGDRAGQLSLDVKHPLRLLFVPADDPLPKKTDGSLDWKLVKTVKILEVEDTHD